MSVFVMPSLGADMESAVLMEWKVKVGDHVSKGDVIAEVETSKGVIEIEVFEDGIIEQLLVEEETDCKVGTPLAMIKNQNEFIDKPVEILQDETVITPSTPSPTAQITSERPRISPAARKKAKELGIDIQNLSENKQSLHLDDIKQEITQSKPIAASSMRDAIARAMSRSNSEIPHYYLSTSINMSPALHWLEEYNATRPIKERILLTALLIRAVVLSLKEVPELNGFWENGAHHISEEIHPGIAIAIRQDGLITPALLDAHTLTLDQTMHSLDDLITRTRSGKLRSSEVTKQTVTITNLGDIGVESVFGVIYPPQVSIIGFGRIIDAPWAEGDTIAVRKVMQATLAGDHRATDGRTGARFLNHLNSYLQSPKELI